MNETDIALAMRDGDLPSPTKFANIAFFKVRVTGTGTALRKGDKDAGVPDEYVYRNPEFYLNEDFLYRCQGLPLIFDHPAGKVLDSEEFGQRMVGTLSSPFIQGSEVWAIARIYDEDCIAILDHERMSTSPTVVFHDKKTNQVIELSNGSRLLIEGEPSLLDHLAICEVGVWDKGGEPSGIISETAEV